MLTLAMHIGVNSAIFTVLNAMIFRPLPFPETERLAILYNGCPGAGAQQRSIGIPDFLDC